MNHFNKISRKAFLAAAGLTVCSQAHALGLGDAEVESYLNQPLIARIDLLNSANDELASVTAKLGSAADYELIGASMESVSVPIQFSIEDVDGDAYIMATSDLPMTHPIVRLIVEVDWSSGRMLREYTLFLDPASIASTAPAPTVSASAVRAATPPPIETTVDATEQQASAVPERPDTESSLSAAAEPAASPVSATEDDDVYGPVQSGETLWRIATDWSSGSGLDVNKVMLAIQRQNPQAFMRNNINLLKRGAILRMPEFDQVEQLSTTAAMVEVQSQTVEFQQRATEGTVTSASTPLLAEDSQRDDDVQASTESAEETVADAANPASSKPDLDLSLEGARDQLELVPPSEASELDSVYGFEENPEGAELTASDNVTSLRENLARTEEDLINEQQQNEYLQQQLEDLEKRLNEQEAAATAKAAELAAMEQRLKAEREALESSSGFTGLLGWLVAIGVGIAVLFGWLFSRRGRAEEKAAADAGEEALRDIADEAEQVLKVLDEEPAEADQDTELESEPDSEPESVSDGELKADSDSDGDATDDSEPDMQSDAETPAAGSEKPGKVAAAAAAMSGHVDDAEILDEDSSDPEIQLDLARAYISMGDKEAARVILEEVMSHGSEEQKADAQAMREKL